MFYNYEVLLVWPDWWWRFDAGRSVVLGMAGVTEAGLLLVFLEVTAAAAAPAFSFSPHSLQLDTPQVIFVGIEI